tara:strand:- start:58 stop:1263 length:1206 start_codon:yes stop_codon:yes gene_type:complete
MNKSFSLKNNIKFANLSGDKNKVHITPEFAKKFFFRECIVHGVNLVIEGLKNFSKNNSNKPIHGLNIKFLNYTCINEKVKFSFSKNRIIIKSKINTKIIIFLKLKKTHSKNYNIENLIKNLMYTTKIIGSYYPGNGSLIINQKTTLIDKIKKKGNKFKFIKNNIIEVITHFKNYKTETLVTKLKVLKKIKSKPIKISEKYKKILFKKNVLILGSRSTLGQYTIKYLSKTNANLYLAQRSTKKKTLQQTELFFNGKNIESIIRKSNPDFVFYFISPAIRKSDQIKLNKTLLQNYEKYYVVMFNNILKNLILLKKKVYIFYPSSEALNSSEYRYKFPIEYILSKKKGENLCKQSFKNNIFPFYYRIHQIISPQNYNIAGKFEGKPVESIKKYIEKFFQCSNFF